jgi:hypothetical protein
MMPCILGGSYGHFEEPLWYKIKQACKYDTALRPAPTADPSLLSIEPCSGPEFGSGILRLALGSTIILGSGSHGTHHHIFTV